MSIILAPHEGKVIFCTCDIYLKIVNVIVLINKRTRSPTSSSSPRRRASGTILSSLPPGVASMPEHDQR